MATMSPLRRRMIEDMTVRNLSPATQQSYLYAVAKFSRYFGVPPAQLGTEQVRAYQLHLIAQKRSWSHINQAAGALAEEHGPMSHFPVANELTLATGLCTRQALAPQPCCTTFVCATTGPPKMARSS